MRPWISPCTSNLSPSTSRYWNWYLEIPALFKHPNLISWSDPGGKWLHGREAVVPPDDAHGLPGVLPLPVFQLCCPDHRLDDCKLWSFNILQLNSPRQLQEVCNLLIGMARSYLDPVSIFQIEVNYKLCLSWKTIQEISLYSGWGGSWES